jgi:hypothetical protein
MAFIEIIIFLLAVGTPFMAGIDSFETFFLDTEIENTLPLLAMQSVLLIHILLLKKKEDIKISTFFLKLWYFAIFLYICYFIANLGLSFMIWDMEGNRFIGTFSIGTKISILARTLLISFFIYYIYSFRKENKIK